MTSQGSLVSNDAPLIPPFCTFSYKIEANFNFLPHCERHQLLFINLIQKRFMKMPIALQLTIQERNWWCNTKVRLKCKKNDIVSDWLDGLHTSHFEVLQNYIYKLKSWLGNNCYVSYCLHIARKFQQVYWNWTTVIRNSNSVLTKIQILRNNSHLRLEMAQIAFSNKFAITSTVTKKKIGNQALLSNAFSIFIEWMQHSFLLASELLWPALQNCKTALCIVPL